MQAFWLATKNDTAVAQKRGALRVRSKRQGCSVASLADTDVSGAQCSSHPCRFDLIKPVP